MGSNLVDLSQFVHSSSTVLAYVVEQLIKVGMYDMERGDEKQEYR